LGGKIFDESTRCDGWREEQRINTRGRGWLKRRGAASVEGLGFASWLCSHKIWSQEEWGVKKGKGNF